MELAHFPPRQPHDIALPWLIAMKGHPATGKSAVAHALAQRLHIPLLDKDDVKDVILDLPGANDQMCIRDSSNTASD